jgi:NAD(P)H dehydrogenase (quinone)
MTKVLIIYHSRNGRTKKLARQIAAGVEKAGASAIIRTVPSITSSTNIQSQPMVPNDGDIFVTKKDLIDCDGLALGSPTHFGNMASELKYFIDSLTDIWLKGALVNKPACVFTASSSMHGGQESTLLSMMLPLFHHGMCIVGLPYSEPELHSTRSGCSPYGVSSVQIDENDSLSNDEKVLSVKMGERLALYSIKLSSRP